MYLSEICIYPIKSLAGIQLGKCKVTFRGLEYDRRFMLTDLNGQFLTQRKFPKMALFKIRIEGNKMSVWLKDQPKEQLKIPLQPTEFQGTQNVQIWKDTCIGSVMEVSVNQWFSDKLDKKCQLVYMAENSYRPIDETYGKMGEIVSFADGYPYLLLGQASVDDLNKRLKKPVPTNRFRANLIFSGGKPFEEDQWQYFKIGELTFRVAKPCARCAVPNINQETAQIEQEPNQTLATFRRFNNKIYVGQNVCWEKDLSNGKNTLEIGDPVTLDYSFSTNSSS